MATDVRPIRPQDVDRVVEFSLRAWQPVFDSFAAVLGEHTYSGVYPDWLRSQTGAIRKACKDPGMDVFVAADNGQLVGFVAVAFHEDPPAGEIDMVAVDPDFSGAGTGPSLVLFALRHIPGRGVDLATVATGGDPSHEPARHIYEAAGFVPLPLLRYHKAL